MKKSKSGKNLVQAKTKTNSRLRLGGIFGTLSWSAPPWLRRVGEWFNREWGTSRAWIRAHRRRFTTIVAISTLSLVALALAYLWYQSRPKPVEFSFRTEAPAPTKIEEGAKPNPLLITFNGSVAKLEDMEKTNIPGVRLQPSIKGSWKWEADSRLVFTPEEEWGIGQEYKVTFDRNLFASYVRLDRYSDWFTTASFQATISNLEFFEDPVDPQLKKVVASLEFNYPVGPDTLAQHVSMKMENASVGVQEILYDKLYSKAFIHSRPIGIPLKDTILTLSLEKGIRPSRPGPATSYAIQRKVRIPGMFTYFQIRSSDIVLAENQEFEMEHVLVVEASTGVLESEMQKNIRVYLLPLIRPAMQGREKIENYSWGNVLEIGPEVLKESQLLELVPIPAQRKFSTLHSFKVRADVGRHLYLKIQKGLKSSGGYILAETYDAILRIPPFPRTIRIMQDGAILSLNGEKKISVLSRNVDALKFVVGRVLTDQIQHLVSQSEGRFETPYFSNYDFKAENITEKFEEIRTVRNDSSGRPQYTVFDFSKYLASGGRSQQGMFFLRVVGWDPVHQIEYSENAQQRFLLVTDLGLLVKKAMSGTLDVFVLSLGSGRPAAGATIEVLGLNGLAVLTQTTEDQGHVRFPSLEDFKGEKKPVAIVARKGNDLAFLPIMRSDRRLDFSGFDTGGVYDDGEKQGLQAYCFSDRGLYRPGDEIRVGFIVKSADWKTNLTGIPVEAAITDPRSLEIEKKKLRLSSSGFEEIRYTTEETAPTGMYHVGIYIVKDNERGSLLGSTSVRVEEFLPDRMRINARFSPFRETGWISPEGLKALVSLKNLFGPPAANRTVAASLTLSPSYPTSREFKDFSFFYPFPAKKSFEERLPNGVSDENGEAVFPVDLTHFGQGTFRLTFFAQGFEAEGGRSVSSETSVVVSSLKYILGYKPDGDLSFIRSGSLRQIRLIALDSELKPVTVKDIEAEGVELRTVSSLVKREDGTYRYQSVVKEIPAPVTKVSIPAKGLNYPLPSDKPGDYLIVFKDSAGTELNRVRFSVVGKGEVSRSLEKTAELGLKLNKTDYVPGEEAEIQVVAPYSGAGLITIERDRVYAFKWFKADTTSSVQRIRIPDDLEGNGYLNVSFVRDIGSPEIFMSPLSYATVPFSLSLEGRLNPVEIEAPDRALPGKLFPVAFKSRKTGKAVIFAVDEGILQVAQYETPDPLAFFFRKKALRVETSQILDLLLPEVSLFRQISGPGGDRGEKIEIGKNLNPFKRKREKPVAFWSGLIDIGPQGGSLTFPIPDYFSGTLRVMAIAVSEDSLGRAEKKAFIRGPFVISPNVPTFVGPGDEFEVSVGVANNVEGSGPGASVTLQCRAADSLEILETARKSLSIPEGREGSAHFRLKAKPILGSARLTFIAQTQGQQSSLSVDLSVRPPAPFRRTITTGFFKNGKVEVPVQRAMYPHYRKLMVSASLVPLGLANGLIGYLEEFPYGCTEQLVSKAFPALILQKRPEFGFSPEKTAASIANTIRVLRARQNDEGAFGFWAANSHVSDFQAVYACHFLTEAKDIGAAVPPDLLSKGLNYLKTIIGRETGSLSQARIQAYAIYILSRNGITMSQPLANLAKDLETAYPDRWKEDLAGIYLAASYKIHKQDSEAGRIIGRLKMGQEKEVDYESFYDGLVRDSQLLYILAKHFPDRLGSVKAEDIEVLMAPIMKGSYNTTSSALAILALAAYADSVTTPGRNLLTVTEIQKDRKSVVLPLPAGLFPVLKFSANAARIVLETQGEAPVFYQVVEAGFDLSPPEQPLVQRLEVFREYRSLSGDVVSQTPLGSQVEVRIRLRTVDNQAVSNIALIDLLPGGFEVVADSLRLRPASRAKEASEDEGQGEEGGQEPIKHKGAASSWSPDYIDIREDRVLFFGTVRPEVREITYRIQATNKGIYKIPPLFGEGMYDRTIQAYTLGGRIVIE
jgi:uncharacterized protein YfaS (alpha-2-macroglobulin family)